MQARDVMSTRIVTVEPDASVESIARLLLDMGISAVPVIDADGRPLGIVSEGDLIRRADGETEHRRSWWLQLFSSAEDQARDYVKTHGHTARSVMTKGVISVTEDTPLAEIAAVLEKKRIKRVPVLRDGKLVGIVSRADLLRALAAHKKAMPSLATPDDRTIRKRIYEEVAERGWISHGSFSVIVVNGAVELWGLVDSEEEREALKLAVGDIEGVSSVDDHLAIVPPYLRGT